jgi:hypothetical protein
MFKQVIYYNNSRTNHKNEWLTIYKYMILIVVKYNKLEKQCTCHIMKYTFSRAKASLERFG